MEKLLTGLNIYNMKKYFLKCNHQEVKLNSTVVLKESIDTKYGKGEYTVTFPLTQEKLDSLIKEGLIYSKEIEHNIEYYVAKLAKTLDVNKEYAYLILNILKKSRPTYAVQLLLKEISESMNSYSNLSKFPVLYIISLSDGKVKAINNSNLNYRSISLFTSRKEAERAKEIVKPLLDLDKDFEGEEQENS